GGGSRIPPSASMVAEGLPFVKMKGNETFKVAVRTLEEAVIETLKANNLEAEEISLLVPHQANIRIIRAVAQRLGLPMEKVMVNVDRYGNTSAASIPIALDEAVREGRVKDGDLLLFEAFGAGLTWASALVRW
ncbi:MAG TPA: 3-oxoacyl-[acyl-carrier-protein] synthase III C-terminal domain-containing protein, partial [Nitrospiria bacterium]|nr:3-oxoacyl-[acyl-carrier-protein] synthase III C-terminal domain-containing protein [Nitrospiria bacterium]